jgi:hypothetical protein
VHNVVKNVWSVITHHYSSSLIAQVIEQLVGHQELPWEGSRLTQSVLRKLGAHKKDVLGLLNRDPEERLTLYQFLNSCSQMLAGTEYQPPHAQSNDYSD